MTHEIAYILGSVALVSSLALVGVLFFSLREERLQTVLTYLVSFAAGTLFGGTFLHLLPEHVAEYGFDTTTGVHLLSGIFLAFVVERFIFWHHHHRPHEVPVSELPYMILLGDSVHNAIDGMIITASYFVSIPLDIATTVAVAAHEIPQEIGDFGVLVYGGFSRTKAIAYNFVSALTAFLGAAFVIMLADSVTSLIQILIPIAAGNFVYIAGSDLIPEFKDESDPRRATAQLVAFVLGIALLYVLV